MSIYLTLHFFSNHFDLPLAKIEFTQNHLDLSLANIAKTRKSSRFSAAKYDHFDLFFLKFNFTAVFKIIWIYLIVRKVAKKCNHFDSSLRKNRKSSSCSKKIITFRKNRKSAFYSNPPKDISSSTLQNLNCFKRISTS